MKELIKYALVVLLLFVTSCKALKIRDIEERKTLSYTNAILSKYENSERPDHILVTNGSLKIKDENTTSLRLTIYSKKHELIFISGRYLGFEIFRLLLTNDSVKFINRAQQSYFFGSREEIDNNILKSISLEEIQNIIYTGFLVQESMGRSSIERQFKPRVDKILYDQVIDEGIKIEMEYDLAGFLEKILFSNHLDSVYLDMLLKRSDNSLENISGSYFRNNYEIKFEFDTNEIKYSPYSKIEFNIGKNYNEIRNIL